ncbi:putative hydroxymethylpyrimidine transport system substrate-binding protein [Faunimonas pinastri]|uniref:Putative hydroxymethylpyrimidine transport system substrate-binding protein n=1 Tax=Faunimonas pinastri TaxID=1855383 RepID=A0A1H9M067_9HYPH|nr:ABC transporter substrate-binding protein [Faunimonas pinastri]SER17062.1 putative hydroxymethylpyrimidine transport system substrate-binding protein [Faunimonas pinastri]
MLKRLVLNRLALGTVAALIMMQSAHAADKLTVMLDWFINPDHAPILVAQQIGAFKDEGLDVEIVPPADPSVPPRLLAAKQVDLALSYQPQLYLLADQGLPVVRVGTLIDHPLNTLLAIEGNGIKDIAGFKGKKIGFSVSGVEDATLGTMLAKGGLSVKDVSLVNVNFQLVSALLSKQVDGVIGAYRNVEVNEIKEHGVTPVVFNVEDYGIPAYDELIILANKDSAKDPRIPKFLAALKKGTDYLLAHPAETWATFAKEHADLNNELNKASWQQTLPMFDKDPAKLDAARYEAYGKFLFDSKLIKKELPVSDYAIDVTK